MEKLFYSNKLFTTPSELSKLLGISVQALHKFNKQIGVNTLVKKGLHIIYPDQARKIIATRKKTYPHLCIHFHNSKGGVGKTTLAHATALKAAALGFKVLAIDSDPQANLSKSFGHTQRSNTRPTFKNLVFKEFKGETITISDTILKLDAGFDLIPSDQSMANFDLELVLKSAGGGVNKFFKPLFDQLKETYDLIIIDSPPSLNSTTLGATFNSDKLIIPTEPEDNSIDGVEQVFQQLNIALQDNYLVKPFVCINKVSLKDYDLDKVAEIMDTYGSYVMKSTIGNTSKYKEQISEDNIVWNYTTKKKPEYISLLENAVSNILDLNSWSIDTQATLSKKEGFEANV